ncbi:quinolinate synthetase complex, A subunit [Thermanaerovibrio velox DSM 12556]|uniref:Quinolinate synthase n=2 Tax=Thermanaerovibrio TaxID=81461 RepID=H0UN12_9BACT|nr:quinolinate synthetase complex, A subunit [Thermanaerovibrio velox DSM 12556]
MDLNEVRSEILRLKEAKGAVILAHNYQIPEVQDVADLVGDSFQLSRAAAGTDHRMIVFCGVKFMAESAKILSPDKKVLLPEPQAGCPMADMVTPEDLRRMKDEHPGVPVVCYVNTSAEVKGECHICCTSSNAPKVVRSLNSKEVIFAPDRNLARFVQRAVPEVRVIPWDGFCPTHERIDPDQVLSALAEHPSALFMAHPECQEEVVKMAHFVGSTSQMLDFAASSSTSEFIVGTEEGMLHGLKKRCPHKTFYTISPAPVCPNMKRTTLHSILRSLQEETHEIILPRDTIDRARASLERMLEVI